MILIDELIVVVVVLFVLTQYVIPIARSRPTFPLFRRSSKLKEAKREFDALTVDLEVNDVDRDIDALAAALEQDVPLEEIEDAAPAEKTTAQESTAKNTGKPKSV